MSEPKMHQKVQNGLAVLSAVAALAGALVMASCGDGGDGGVPPNASTISGHVKSFAVAESAVKMDQPLNERARSGVANVLVSVDGTDLKVTTAEDGLFVLSGVPPGLQTLTFTWGAHTATYTIDVPANSAIVMGSVNVKDDGVSVQGVVVTEASNDNAGADDNANDNAGADDNANDNVGSDDNANDNVGWDDNANDNDGIDDNANDNDWSDDNANDNLDDNANDNDWVDDNANDNDGVDDNANDNI